MLKFNSDENLAVAGQLNELGSWVHYNNGPFT